MFHKSGEQGYVKAQVEPGGSYQNGEGVIEDYVDAYKWLLLAGMNGEDVSKQKEYFKILMTVEQITEAQKKTKELVSKKAEEKSTEDDKIKELKKILQN